MFISQYEGYLLLAIFLLLLCVMPMMIRFFYCNRKKMKNPENPEYIITSPFLLNKN